MAEHDGAPPFESATLRGPQLPVPRELPPDISGFTGRTEQLDELDRLLDGSRTTTSVVISSLSGTAGVGKTALAVHWGHRVSGRFPDGQLYVNLRGYDTEDPAAPEDVLADLLRALGIAEATMPAGLDRRASMYRSMVADRRILVILDNARTVDQIEPLLPGTVSCFVVVTSRDALPGLSVTQGASRVTVDLLSHEDAVDLLRRRLTTRVDDEPAAADELVEQCACLPIALRIVAELALERPQTKLRDLAGELADERRKLALLGSHGHARIAVRSVFSWSYQQLSPLQARAFRLMSVPPSGCAIDDYGLAALTGDITRAEAGDALHSLMRVNLVRQAANGRFFLHDLLRAYSAELGGEGSHRDEREHALDRLFVYHTYMSCRALDLLNPQHGRNRPVIPGPASPTLKLKNDEQAIAWLAAERQNVVAIARRFREKESGDQQSPVTALCRVAAEHNLGLFARHVGDVPGALQHFERASRALASSEPSYLRRIWLDQAEALLLAGLSNEAANSLDEVIAAAEHAVDDADLAEAELLRAVAALLDGNGRVAHEFAHAAERRFSTNGDIGWSAVAALTRLRADVKFGLANGAVTGWLAECAVRLADRLHNLRLVDESAAARLLAVRVLLRLGRVGEAEAEMDRVPKPRYMTPTDHQVLRWLCRAEIAVAMGNRRRALSCVRNGLIELDHRNDRPAGPDLAGGTAMHARELGQLGIQMMLSDRPADQDPQRLFAWVELARATAYRYESPIDDPALAERVDAFRQLTRSLQLAQLRGEPAAELVSRHNTLQHEISRLGRQANTRGGSRRRASFFQLTDQLGDRAFVNFLAIGETQLAVVIVGRNAHVVQIGSRRRAEELAWELYADIDAYAPDDLPQPIAEVVIASARRRAGCLDDLLLAPLAKLLSDRELVIVPSGPLHSVSWGSLPSLQSRPYVVTPSATAWLAAELPPKRDRVGETVLIRGPGVETDGSEFEGLLRLYPHAVSLSGRDATVAAVLECLDGAGMAHLAVQGQHEPENALFSRLELADGPLFAHDVLRLGVPPAQVVLAASELALTHVRPGDEPLGFAGALLASGVSTVVAAVTRVGRNAATQAMTEFHRRVAAGSRPASALALVTAQDPYRRPFVCVGSS
ncbi:tetratricopeptide (TPR) repeat protein [Amycolatopsis lexingtonensis]|uniref:Tetratricopeptide (TPR) repeat protein n=1 Tax=Amycolatopsis lexingtonensis TaxID=218822 RepID=A0ABR9HZ92_9PSEU|nr:CHAT domain-containing protein [Amycolatopsis lexingtonensis]MBE1496236.1 tetratricopeptide (TPR) repeat protein [Amycolatopsis lexingtonensis]